MALVDEALEEAWTIINTEDGWKKEKDEKGDVVMSRKNKKGESTCVVQNNFIGGSGDSDSSDGSMSNCIRMSYTHAVEK